MRALRSDRAAMWLAVVLFSSATTSAADVVVDSQMNEGISTAAAGAGGTWKGFAFSQAAGWTANGLTEWHQYVDATGEKQTIEKPAPLAWSYSGKNSIDLVFGATQNGPPVAAGRAKNLLVAPYDVEGVISGGAVAKAWRGLNINLPRGRTGPGIGTNSWVRFGGSAAAIASDPVTIAPGTYQLRGTIINTSFNISLGGPNDLGQVKFEAFDSRYGGGGLSRNGPAPGRPERLFPQGSPSPSR